MKATTHRLPLLLILVLTLLANLLTLESRGLWQDEGLTLYQIRLPLEEVLRNQIPVAQYVTQNTVPPLYFVLVHLWGTVIGFSLWSVRAFSAFTGVLAVAALYRTGRTFASQRVGLIAALLLAISPLLRWYAQEMRMYSLLVLLATLSLLLLWKTFVVWRVRHSAWARLLWPFAYLLVALALLWTHYLSILLIGTQLLWLFLFTPRRYKVPAFLLMLLLVGGSWPLIGFGWRRLTIGAERDFVFQPLGQLAFDLLQSFSFGLPTYTSRLEEVWFALPLVVVLLVVGAWALYRRYSKALAAFVLLQSTVPLLAIYALSYIKPMYQNARHLIVMLPPFILLWAIGLAALSARRRWLSTLLLLAFAWGWLASTAHYYKEPSLQKNDVGPLFQTLAERWQPGEVVALNEALYAHVLEYFDPHIPWLPLPPYGEQRPDERAIPAYEALANTYARLWYVFGPPDSGSDSWQHPQLWLQQNARILDEINFPGQTAIGATLYDLRPLTLDPATPIASPMRATFGEHAAFLGLLNAVPEVKGGQTVILDTLWAGGDGALAELDSLAIRLTDNEGRFWPTETKSFLVADATTGDPSAIRRAPVLFTVPIDLPPGRYGIELSAVDGQGSAVARSDADTLLIVGAITVGRATEKADVAGPTAGGLRVQTTPFEETLSPGTPIPFFFRVRVESMKDWPESWQIEWVAADGEVEAMQSLPLEDGSSLFTPDQWRKGDVFELRYELRVPRVDPNSYTLRLVPYQGDMPLSYRLGWLRHARTLFVGQVTVEAIDQARIGAGIEVRVDAAWPEAVTLLGYTSEITASQTGKTLILKLTWEAQQSTPETLKVFVHLFNAQNERVAVSDTFFDIPSIVWQPNERLTTTHEFQALATGQYRIMVGLYSEATGERLYLPDWQDAVQLPLLRVDP